MAEEQKTATAPNTNVEAEKDVQNVLAELKGEGEAPAEKKQEDEEARIVAEAAKLGEKSEKSEEKTEKKPESESRQEKSRGYRNYRDNIKFDPATQKETDDPVEIRKQVSWVMF